MRKRILCSLFLISVLFVAGCAKYQESDFLGKTSAQIVEQYGEFDCIYQPAEEDGLYRSTACGYTTKEPHVGFLGTSPEELFYIVFDDNGIAVRCYEGYRPGG